MFGFQILWQWAYMIKVIPEMHVDSKLKILNIIDFTFI